MGSAVEELEDVDHALGTCAVCPHSRSNKREHDEEFAGHLPV
jgi:hypothetical protein